MLKVNWRGLAALILAAGVAAGIVILALPELQHPGHVDGAVAVLLAAVLGVAAGGVVAYLAGRDTPRD